MVESPDLRAKIRSVFKTKLNHNQKTPPLSPKMKSLVISFPFCMSSFIFLRPVKVPISVAPFPVPEPRATDPIMGAFTSRNWTISAAGFPLPLSQCNICYLWFLRHFNLYPCLILLNKKSNCWERAWFVWQCHHCRTSSQVERAGILLPSWTWCSRCSLLQLLKG